MRSGRAARDDWMKVFDGTDACVAPVLSMEEAPKHPHNVARKTFETAFGVVQPGPAPRFSRTAGAINGGPPALAGKHSHEVLKDWGVADWNGLPNSCATALSSKPEERASSLRFGLKCVVKSGLRVICSYLNSGQQLPQSAFRFTLRTTDAYQRDALKSLDGSCWFCSCATWPASQDAGLFTSRARSPQRRADGRQRPSRPRS